MSYKKHRRHLQAPWVSVTRSLLDQPAWKAMSFGARALYIALKRYYNTKIDNNGKIYLSCRDACEALGTRSTRSIVRWFTELEFYGFIVKKTKGCLLWVTDRARGGRWAAGCVPNAPGASWFPSWRHSEKSSRSQCRGPKLRC